MQHSPVLADDDRTTMCSRSRVAQVHPKHVCPNRTMSKMLPTAPKYPPYSRDGSWVTKTTWEPWGAEHDNRKRWPAADEESDSAMGPPAKKSSPYKKAQHCRFFDFGRSTCHLASCNYAHIDELNWDHHEKKWLREGANGYVTAELVEKLGTVHEEARRRLHHDKKEETVTVADELEDKASEVDKTTDTMSCHMSDSLLQTWLDDAREEDMQEHSVFRRDRVTLAFQGQKEKVRFPLEAAVWETPEGPVSITMHKKIHVMWSCMLYGSGKGVMRHLQSCLLLGYKLRYELKPLLLKMYNIEFENVLFVTETSLDEPAFRACSFMWSMVFKDVPEVHETRLSGTSSHLIGEGLDAAHVFLKVEAFKAPAELSIISDLDLVVTSPKALALYISTFMAGGKFETTLRPGSVMVMQRGLSEINFGAKPPQMTQQDLNSYHQEQGHMPVSYCWAFIRPTKELAERYEAYMKAPSPKQGLLSDQDLLAEVIAIDWHKANHDFIAFPSWWVHWDICSRRAQEVMEHNMEFNKKKKDWRVYGADLANDIGAFHLSKSFDFETNAQDIKTKVAGWISSMKMSAHWGTRDRYVWPESRTRRETYHDYILVLTGLWEALQQEQQNQVNALTAIIVDSVQELQPGLGMMKSLVTLLNPGKKTTTRRRTRR